MNNQVKDLLRGNSRRGSIIFIGSTDWTGQLVSAGESLVDKTSTNKLTHVVFRGSDGRVYESTIGTHVVDRKLIFSSGVKITDFEKWMNGVKARYILIMNLDGLTDKQIKIATGTALRLKEKKMYYPVFELVGTLMAGVAWTIAGWFKNKKAQDKILASRNPLDGKNGEYCIAFVNHCFESAERRIIPVEINESVCNVGDGLRGHDGFSLYQISPNIKAYTKLSGEKFNFEID